jgi:hypothetical protein
MPEPQGLADEHRYRWILTNILPYETPGSPFLLIAGDINDDGTIVGQAFHPDTQASPAFMATPRSEQESEEPGNVLEIQTP